MTDLHLADQYVLIARESREKYGDKCLVLMQCGTFYEVYDVTCDDSHWLGICREVLYLRVGKKEKNMCHVDGDAKPVFFAGFKVDNFARYRSMLLQHKFTVLLIDQDEDNPSVRSIRQVVSPGCDEHADASVVVVVLLHAEKFTVCRYDFLVNQLHVFELGHSDPALLRHILHEWGSCTEIEAYDIPAEQQSRFKLSFSGVALHFKALHRSVFSRDWQRMSLESHYKRFVSVGCDIFGKLGVDNEPSNVVASLLCMLTFLRSHDEGLRDIFPIPNLASATNVCVDPRRVSVLESTFAFLNIFGDGPKTVIDVIGRYVRTPMGKCLLREWLRTPTCDHDVLNARYDGIDAMIHFVQTTDIDSSLRRIRDVRQMALRMRKLKVSIEELRGYGSVLRDVANVVEEINTSDVPVELDEEPYAALKRTVGICALDVAALAAPFENLDLTKRIGMYEETKRVLQKREAMEAWQANCRSCAGVVPGHKSVAHLSGSFRSGYVMQCTATKAAKLKQCDSTKYAYAGNGSNVRFTSTEVVDLMDDLASAETDLAERANDALRDIVCELNALFFDVHVEPIAQHIALVDVLQGVARQSRKHHYVRPVLTPLEDVSRMSVKGLRHPVLEVLVDEAGRKYVTNDIDISHDSSFLLYGMNSVGKSSLLKSIALAGLLAQAGLFVPCTELRLTPYRNYMLHIGGKDDMYNGQSTFVREIEMLRTVLRASVHGGPTTLFLSDELGNSTEDASAVRIVASLLHTLHSRLVSIAVATHMFALQNNSLALGCHGIRNMHLAVRVEGKDVIFERRLREGLPQIPKYGCLLAEKLLQEDLPFVQALQSGRHDATAESDVLPLKRSRYNSKARAMACALCDYKPVATHDQPLEWHHIGFQCTAQNGKLPDGSALHATSNLTPVCRPCHQAIHSHKHVIHGYRDTLNGTELVCDGDLTVQ